MGTRKCRKIAAKRLAERIYENPTEQQIDEAYHLINRLACLAHDNEKRCARDNDPLYWQGDWRQRKHDRWSDRWMERAKEIEGLFAKYRCEVVWPGCYPTVDDIDTGCNVIFTDLF